MDFLYRVLIWLGCVSGGFIVAMVPMFVLYALAIQGTSYGWFPEPLGAAFFLLGTLLPLALMDLYLAILRGQSLRAYWIELGERIRRLPAAAARATTSTLKSLTTVVTRLLALGLPLLVLGTIASAVAGAPGWALVIIVLLFLIWLK